MGVSTTMHWRGWPSQGRTVEMGCGVNDFRQKAEPGNEFVEIKLTARHYQALDKAAPAVMEQVHAALGGRGLQVYCGMDDISMLFATPEEALKVFRYLVQQLEALPGENSATAERQTPSQVEPA